MACAQMSNYADAMETQVAAVHRHSKRFIERHRALASSMSGFGLSLTQLANCEADINPSLARALSSMGMSVDRMSNLYDEQVLAEKLPPPHPRHTLAAPGSVFQGRRHKLRGFWHIFTATL